MDTNKTQTQKWSSNGLFYLLYVKRYKLVIAVIFPQFYSGNRGLNRSSSSASQSRFRKKPEVAWKRGLRTLIIKMATYNNKILVSAAAL